MGGVTAKTQNTVLLVHSNPTAAGDQSESETEVRVKPVPFSLSESAHAFQIWNEWHLNSFESFSVFGLRTVFVFNKCFMVEDLRARCLSKFMDIVLNRLCFVTGEDIIFSF